MLGETEATIHRMEYPVLAGGPARAADPESPVSLFARVRDLEAKLERREKEIARQVEEARREALEKGRELAQGEQALWRRQCTAELTAAIEQFRASRDEYLARVEQEVVRLALAIAERILHREAQMDPLLLAGAVRVALGQLADSTEVQLRVPSDQASMWEEMLRLMPGLPLRPRVQEAPGLHACEARLETTLGSVDLGVRAQIAEIERGFFDLLEIRRDAKQDQGEPAVPRS